MFSDICGLAGLLIISQGDGHVGTFCGDGSFTMPVGHTLAFNSLFIIIKYNYHYGATSDDSIVLKLELSLDEKITKNIQHNSTQNTYILLDWSGHMTAHHGKNLYIVYPIHSQEQQSNDLYLIARLRAYGPKGCPVYITFHYETMNKDVYELAFLTTKIDLYLQSLNTSSLKIHISSYETVHMDFDKILCENSFSNLIRHTDNNTVTEYNSALYNDARMPSTFTDALRVPALGRCRVAGNVSFYIREELIFYGRQHTFFGEYNEEDDTFEDRKSVV